MTDFSAAPSATGYLYQVSWALADLLTKAPERPDQAVAIEGADDVEWSTAEGEPSELLQTKVHGPDVPASTGVTDKAVDLWKTLRVWMERPNAFDAEGPDLTLVTTSVASQGSAAWFLAPGGAVHRSGLCTTDASGSMILTCGDAEQWRTGVGIDPRCWIRRAKPTEALASLDDEARDSAERIGAAG